MVPEQPSQPTESDSETMSTSDPAKKEGTDTDCKPAPTQSNPDLTKFQLRILAVLKDGSRYGLAVKRELEDYYGEDVNHGRLYPNLNTLVEKDLVEKSELDKRTNEYALTDGGDEVVVNEVVWLARRVTSAGDQ